MHILLWSETGDWVETDKLDVLEKILAEKTHRAWVDVNEPTEEDLRLLGKLFQLHPLSIRAIRDRVDDPKIIDFDNHYLFLVLHRVFYDFQTEQCELREFEVCISDHFILTTHTSQLSRTFATAREKVIEHKKECITHGPSYILFRLLNLAIADYQPAIQEWQDALDEIEQKVLKEVKDQVMERILDFKKLVAKMRKQLIPEREVLRELYESSDLPSFSPAMRPYFKMILDNMNAVFLDLEHLRDHATSVFEVYATTLSHQINFVMQRLTIAATIFMPLTFIVGVYGMNFNDMPEFGWKGFYFILWGVMLTVVVVMLLFFRRKKWL